jgi:hypothetical protein
MKVQSHRGRLLHDVFDERLTELSESVNEASSYTFLKNSLPIKEELKEKLNFLSSYHRGSLRKMVSKKYVAIPISRYPRLRDVPLRELALQFKKRKAYLKDFIEVVSLLNEVNKKLVTMFKETEWLLKYYVYLMNSVKQLYYNLTHSRNRVDHIYFFKRIYKYHTYKYNIGYKNNIPTYNWVETIWKRRVAKPLLSAYGAAETTETFTLNTYYDLSSDSMLIKARFFFKYIFKKYPYRMNKHDNP